MLPLNIVKAKFQLVMQHFIEYLGLHLRLFLSLSFVSFCSIGQTCWAITPAPPAGWPAALLNRPSNIANMLPLQSRAVTYSSPVVGDIDGDSSNGLEIAAGSTDGTLQVFSATGAKLWSANLPIKRCRGGKSNKLLSSPAIGDIFGNGMPAVVVGYGGVGKSCDGGVAAFRGSDGKKLWNFSTKRFSKKAKFWAFRYSVFSTPGLADTDGDGRMEIGFGSFDRNVYLLNSNGSVRWYYNAADTVWSSPTFANVDSDKNLEMIIGTDISANSKLNPPTHNGGYVYAFKTQARKSKHIGFRDSEAYVWQTPLDQVVYSSPMIGDVIPESEGPEVVVGSGCFFPQNSSNKDGRWIKILRLRDGKVLKTLETEACFSSSVAIGDIDEDGVNEIVATINGHRSVGGDGNSKLVAYKASQTEPLWSVTPKFNGRNDEWGGHFISPVIADLDGNGSLEVIVANSAGVSIFSGKNGTALTCQTSDCSEEQVVLKAGKSLKNTPAIADIDGDGSLEIVAAGTEQSSAGKGAIYVWSEFLENLGSALGSLDSFSSPWPMFKKNSQRNSN